MPDLSDGEKKGVVENCRVELEYFVEYCVEREGGNKQR
jgi:hypothetical protein